MLLIELINVLFEIYTTKAFVILLNMSSAFNERLIEYEGKLKIDDR